MDIAGRGTGHKPFPFAAVCDLLQSLEPRFVREIPLLPSLQDKQVTTILNHWLRRHKSDLDACNSDAWYHCIWPDKLVGYEYGLDADGLQRLLSRALCFSQITCTELEELKQRPDCRDLGWCFEKLMKNTPGAQRACHLDLQLSVDQIDHALLVLASRNPCSSDAVRSLCHVEDDPLELLNELFTRLRPRDLKWLIRLIQKDYSPIVIPVEFEDQSSALPRISRPKILITPAQRIPCRAIGVRGKMRGVGSIEARNSLSTPQSTSWNAPTTPVATPCKTLPPSQPTTVAGTFPTLSITQTPFPTPPTSSLSERAEKPILRPPILPNEQPKHTRRPRGQNHRCPLVSPPPFRRRPLIRLSPSASQSDRPTRTRIKISSNSTPPQTRMSSSSAAPTRSGYSSTALAPISSRICKTDQTACSLKNCIFVLSPDLSSSPRLLEDLLPSHACRVLASPSHLSTIPSRPKLRKIALVEPRQLAQTVDFLKRIQALGLQRKGRKEYVEAYDWRLLEMLRRVDSGRELGFDPWERCWMGAC